MAISGTRVHPSSVCSPPICFFSLKLKKFIISFSFLSLFFRLSSSAPLLFRIWVIFLHCIYRFFFKSAWASSVRPERHPHQLLCLWLTVSGQKLGSPRKPHISSLLSTPPLSSSSSLLHPLQAAYLTISDGQLLSSSPLSTAVTFRRWCSLEEDGQLLHFSRSCSASSLLSFLPSGVDCCYPTAPNKPLRSPAFRRKKSSSNSGFRFWFAEPFM